MIDPFRPFVKRGLCVLVVLVSMGAFAACDSADEDDLVSGPIEWGVVDVIGERKVRIVALAGACGDRHRPRISDVRIVYDDRLVYITAELFVPPELEVAARTACSGTGLLLYRTVELERDVRDSVLLDASEEPAQVRWPLPDDG
jgi:hypothetical protein